MFLTHPESGLNRGLAPSGLQRHRIEELQHSGLLAAVALSEEGCLVEGHGLHGLEFWAWVRGCLGLGCQRSCAYGPHRRGTERNQVSLAPSSQPCVAGSSSPVLDPFI